MCSVTCRATRRPLGEETVQSEDRRAHPRGPRPVRCGCSGRYAARDLLFRVFRAPCPPDSCPAGPPKWSCWPRCSRRRRAARPEGRADLALVVRCASRSPEGEPDRVPDPTARRSGLPSRAQRPGIRSPTVVVRRPRRLPVAAASHGVGFFLQGLTTSSRSGIGSASPASTLVSRPDPRRLPRRSLPGPLQTGALPSWTSSLPQSPLDARSCSPPPEGHGPPSLAGIASSLSPKASRPNRSPTPCSPNHLPFGGDQWFRAPLLSFFRPFNA